MKKDIYDDDLELIKDIDINEKEIDNIILEKDPNISDCVKLYLKDIGNKPLLTKEEELSLLDKAKNGDTIARNELITRNARLVLWCAKKYIGHGLSFSDLVEEGNFGLIKATLKFDTNYNVRFSTYAVRWIEQCMRRAINDQGRTIRIPVHIHELIAKIKKIENKLTQELNRDPTIEEIKDELGENISLEKIKNIILLTMDTVSLDTPIGDDNDFYLKDLIEDNKILTPDELSHINIRNNALYKAITKLTPKEQEVIYLRYGLNGDKPHTLEEIGLMLNVTRERVRQIQAKALFKLKSMQNEINPEE